MVDFALMEKTPNRSMTEKRNEDYFILLTTHYLLLRLLCSQQRGTTKGHNQGAAHDPSYGGLRFGPLPYIGVWQYTRDTVEQIKGYMPMSMP